MFKMDYIECSGVILIYFISLGMCQDRIIVSNSNSNETYSNSSMEDHIIPETLLIQMKDVKNISDLLRRFVAFEEESSLQEPALRNGTESRRALSAAATATVAQPANCQTEQHVIELDKPENGATIFWPSCVRVRRCGGCCTSSMLACKPLATSILNVTVLQMFYNHQTPNSFESQGTRVFSLEQHDRCACTCKEISEDCNPGVHDYRGNECRCVCKNAEQAASCTGPKKIWDSRDCACKCRNFRMCSSGLRFNEGTCRCEILRRSLDAQSSNHNSTSLSSQVVTVTP